MNLSSDESSDSVLPAPSAAAVGNFLKANPEFFADYPDVLGALELRHPSGDAISLVERQITALREENARLKTRFQDLVEVAESNQHLMTRIHQLALALMSAAGPQAIFATLREKLAADFAADDVKTLIFAESSLKDADAPAEFLGGDDTEGGRAAFQNVFASGAVQCGPMSHAQAEALLERGDFGGSAVLMPLSGKDWDGILMISSDEPSRFNRGMGTEFLAYLGDIVALIIDPWVARSHSA